MDRKFEVAKAEAMLRPGATFGRLMLVVSARRGKYTAWECRCECGATTIVRSDHLRSGATRSCGCGEGNRKHGYGTRFGRGPEYIAWGNMIERCGNPANPRFKQYGGRGIYVCTRWRSFENFLADIGHRPAPGLTLDRIDNDKGYEPGNCRWATYQQQNLNRRHTRRSA